MATIDWADARFALGLPAFAYRTPLGEYSIVFRCARCGTLYGGLSANPEDQFRIVPGDCLKPWKRPNE